MMLSWWFDLLFLIALGLIGYSMYRMQGASEASIALAEGEAELGKAEEAEREVTSTPLLPENWRELIYPRQLIRQAGIIPENITIFYWIAKFTLALLLPLMMAETLGGFSTLLTILLVFLGFTSVDLWLLLRRRWRRQKIERVLGYFVDLIAAFLHSGLNLAEAFEQASTYGLPRNNPLVREVDLVAREMRAGSDRVTAFYALAERTGVEDVLRLAALMSVGFRLGSPIGETLEAQAELLRAKQWEEAEALVNRRALEALFPMLLVSIPLIMVLVFFPAAVQIFELFGQFSGNYD